MGYYVGWKYKTPLKSEYLSTFLKGFTTEGLLERPTVSYSSGTVTISPFTAIVRAYDKDTGSYTNQYITVTTDAPISIQITSNHCAIGMKFMKNVMSEYVPEIVALAYQNETELISDFKGIILATINYDGTTVTVSTEGADISTFLLVREGWNPHCWISVISPRRATSNQFNTGDKVLEMRTGNDLYSNYFNDSFGISNGERYLNYEDLCSLSDDAFVGPDNSVSGKQMSIYSKGASLLNSNTMISGRIMAVITPSLTPNGCKIVPVESMGANINVVDSELKVL